MRKALLLGFCLLWLFLPHFADVDLFGYFENRFFLLNFLDQEWEQFNDKIKLGDYNRLRLHLQAQPVDKVTVNLAVDFFSFHGMMQSPLGIYGDGTETSGNSMTINLDRAYIDLNFKSFDFSLGKQRVALGVSYIWAPLDIFNRVNFFEPKEEKPGANALKVYIPLGSVSAITAVFSPESEFKFARSAIRAKTQLLGVDLALTLMQDGLHETSIYGVDLRGENFIGWWLEGGYFVDPRDEYYKFVLGFDYTFPIGNGLYWLNEYYYDSSGQKDSSLYDFDLLMSGDRYTLGRSYFFSMLRYQVSDFTSLVLTYIANWGDGSFMISPVFSYDIIQNVSLSTGFYFPLGKESGEFSLRRTDVFFIWLKINF